MVWYIESFAFILYYRDVNNDMMELQIIAYACKTSSARNIVGVIPYLPYSKQCKMRKRGSIVCKLLARMLSKSGNFDFQGVLFDSFPLRKLH